MCLRFLKSYFKLEILILALHGVFLVDLFNEKAPFLTKKNISGKIWTYLEKLSKFNVAKF